jgi:uracil phosphoribosyltransferase
MNATISPMDAPDAKIQKNKNANYFEFRNFFKKIKKFITNKASKIFKPKKKFVKEPEPEEKNKNIKKKKPYWTHIYNTCYFIFHRLSFLLFIIK